LLEESHPFPLTPCLSQEVATGAWSSLALPGLAEMYSHTHPEGKMGWRGEAEVVQEDTHLPQPPLAITEGRETHPSSAEVFLPSSSDLAD